MSKPSKNKKKPLNICICFFGVISRSIDKTIHSIRKNIFEEITAHGHKYDVYVHNMNVKEFKSTRAGDSGTLVDKCGTLPYDYFTETKQEHFDKKFNWAKFSKYGYQENNYNTFQNSLRQLHSIKKVTEMWQNSKIDYDYFVYLRPDLEYTNKLDVKQIEVYHNKNFLLTPKWARHRGGLNDRIYMGPRNIIKHFGLRLDYIMDIMNEKKQRYHPEQFMKYVSQKFSIKTKDISFYGRRVRSDGRIHDPP